MRLLLVRHGETVWNVEHRYQGQSDTALNDAGRSQAAALGRRLADVAIDAAYSSDLRRSWDTAQAIRAARMNGSSALSLQADPRLRELQFGAWEGLTRDEIAARHADSLRAWQSGSLDAQLPGGESVRSAAGRIRAALDEITRRHADQTVLIVSHGGTLQIMCCLFLANSLHLRRCFRFTNASLSEVRVQSTGAAIHLLNDTSHLHMDSCAAKLRGTN